MKKLLVFLLLTNVSCIAQPSGPSDNATGKGAAKHPHPRLLLLKSEEKAAFAQIAKQAQWLSLSNALIAECDKIIALPVAERVVTGRRLLSVSRESLRRIFQLAYAYRATGSEKYFKRAEAEMLAVAAFSDWNPSHFLDVGEMTMAMAIGYDWLFDKLPETSRKTIREAIVHKGIDPSYDSKYNWFLTAEHNWNQVCNAGMTFGALAVAEDYPELAEKTIKRAAETIVKSMDASYKPEGAYPEGFGYWDYGTSFNVLFLSAVDKALGTDYGLSKTQGFLQTAGFMQSMAGPTGIPYNWGDAGVGSAGLVPASFWFAEKAQDNSLLWWQKQVLDKGGVQGIVRNRLAPSILIWGANSNVGGIQPPSYKIWKGQGHSPVALMRTSWTDPNAIYVGFKTGSPSVNHAHMDIGSFVLDANGERWAMDFGMQDYNSLESKGVDLWNRSQNSQRWEVFRLNNFVHNTLTINDQLQQVKGYAKIDTWLGDDKRLSATSNLSELYADQANSVQRGIAIVDNNYTVVRDEVQAKDKPMKVRWTLLTSATVSVVDGKTIELTKNNKKYYVVIDSETPIQIKTWSTEPPHDYDAPNPGTILTGFETEVPANATKSWNVFFSADKKTAAVSPLAQWPGNK